MASNFVASFSLSFIFIQATDNNRVDQMVFKDKATFDPIPDHKKHDWNLNNQNISLETI